MVAVADVSGAQASQSMNWGGQTQYKSMTLDTLEQPKKFKANDDPSRSSLIRYRDVDGARPAPAPHSRITGTGYKDGSVFPRNNAPMPPKEPVEKSTPAPHYDRTPRLDMSLVSKDITESAQGHPQVLVTSRSLNPLNPAYQMATARYAPPHVPKFIRDAMDPSDINCKAELSPRIFLNTTEARPTSLYVGDIDGSTPRQRTLRRSQRGADEDDVSRQLNRWDMEDGAQQAALLCTQSLLNFSSPSFRITELESAELSSLSFRMMKLDMASLPSLVPWRSELGDPPPLPLSNSDGGSISRRLPWKIEETSRHTNPLEPAYRYNVPPDAPEGWTYGKVDNIKSKRFFTGAKMGETPGRGAGGGDTTYREFISRTDDIEGASVGTKGRFMSRTSPFYRTQEGRLYYVDDMEGTKPNGAFSLLPKYVVAQRAMASSQGGGMGGGAAVSASGSQTAREMGASARSEVHVATPLSARGVPKLTLDGFASTGGRGSKAAMTPRLGTPSKSGLSPQVGGGTPRVAGGAPNVGFSPKFGGTPQLPTPRIGGTPRVGGTPRGSATPRALNNKLLSAFSTG